MTQSVPPGIRGRKEDTEVSLIMAAWENQCCERRKHRKLGGHMTQPVFHREIHLQVQSYQDNGAILDMNKVH